ncbi:MAG: serine protease [Ferruginibacter sp.]
MLLFFNRKYLLVKNFIMENTLKVFITYAFIIQMTTLIFTSCNNAETTETTKTTVDSLKTVEELQSFSKEELYEELLARSTKPDKNITSDTVPVVNYKLKEYSDKELYEVIYDIDDRKNIYEITDTMLLNDAKKAACIIMKDQLISNPDGTFSIKLKGVFKNVYGLCDEENFSNEPVSPFCSGFAVSKNIFITAGHCVEETNLDKILIVYGFAVNKANNVNQVIKPSDIFKAERIVKRELNTTTKNDYCVIKISGEFGPERISKIRMVGKINDDEDVHVIGYPCGLPVKITPNGKVYNNSISNYFVTNLDTYGGNSGSPVFNSKTHLVEGILVRGNQDFPMISIGSCKRSLICPRTIGHCNGEDVTRTSQFWQWIK